MAKSNPSEYVEIKNEVKATTKGSTPVYIRDYGDEPAPKDPEQSREENLRQKENLLKKIAELALQTGYIGLPQCCYVLAEDPEYNTDGLLNVLSINRQLITKSAPFLLPGDDEYNKRRGEWYFILLRIVTGLNSDWSYDDFHPSNILADSYLPLYKSSVATGKIELISDEDRRSGQIKAHGCAERFGSDSNLNQTIRNVLISLKDLKKWFAEYLGQPLPKRLFPTGGVGIEPTQSPIEDTPQKLSPQKIEKNEVDYSKKSRNDQALLAHAWFESGMTISDIAQKLFPHGHANLESLKRKVRRLREDFPAKRHT